MMYQKEIDIIADIVDGGNQLRFTRIIHREESRQAKYAA